MSSVEQPICTVEDPLWQAASWLLLSLSAWLLYLFFADTLERGVIFRTAKRPLASSFRFRAFVWLAALLMAGLAAWKVWSAGCWSLRGLELSCYCLTLLFTVLSWRHFWVGHRFLGSVLLGVIAFLLAVATLLAFFVVSPVAGALFGLYPLVQLYEIVYNWLFYRANMTTDIANRPTGRFQEKDLRRIADVWFVNPQQPTVHTIATEFATSRATLGDY